MASSDGPVPPSSDDPGPVPEVDTIDYHTAGEPFRIVADPPVAIAGATVADRRARALTDPSVDAVRRLLCHEPRGHADMYGCFVVPPDDEGAHLGALFWHKDGFSTACGHGTIALGTWAVDDGLVHRDPSGTTEVRVDVPSGRVTARVHTAGERVVTVDFVNVASYVLADGLEVETSRGPVTVGVAYGGAIYIHVEASALGLAVTPRHHRQLIEIGRELTWLLDDHPVARHPDDDRLSGVYGTILHDDLGVDQAGHLHQRNVTVFADGEVDRSPCGSGTCARLVALAGQGRLDPGQVLVHHSIVGTTFTGRLVAEAEVAAGHRAWIPEVSGSAHRTGRHHFVLDPHDPLGTGFVLR